ncbi:hypothetical protein BJ085DRAFT_28040 [Dimargaris cristalligena]|uniref:Uncharacterized protein n=1 Tax=Dimargaris cristalligena TaxID=215637 RepID=A0A4P9ZNS6_9FUNG|nr:hypothetical protein BJ085DRAFT_28040 [Dimargaris cristalligena]|eukprot:RKP35086.1 hypothetical protein BJ085DRAFT_28040 [Dimargaris cristalligena]
MSRRRDLFHYDKDIPGPGTYNPISPQNRYRRYGFISQSDRFTKPKPPGPGGLSTPAMVTRNTPHGERLLRRKRVGLPSNQIPSAEVRVQHAEAELAKLQRANTTLQAQISQAQQFQGTSQADLQATMAQYKRLQHQHQTETSRLQDEIRNSRNELQLRRFLNQETETNLLYRQKSLQNQVSQLEKQLYQHQRAAAHQTTELRQDAEEFRDTINQLNRQLVQRNQDLIQANALKDQIRAEGQQEAMSLQSKIRGLEGQLVALRQTGVQHQAEIADLKDQLRRQDHRHVDADQRHAETVQTLEEHLGEAREEAAAILGRHAELEGQVEYLTAQIIDLEREYEESAVSHRTELKQTQRQATEFREALERALAENSQIADELKTVQQTAETQEHQAIETQRHLQSRTKALEALWNAWCPSTTM